jgi:hypothetical protein
MNEKGKVVAELSDEKWLWNLALLCVISHHLNDLKYQTSTSTELISDTFGAVRAFEMKLENVNLCHFSSWDLLHQDGSVSVPFPSGCAG